MMSKVRALLDYLEQSGVNQSEELRELIIEARTEDNQPKPKAGAISAERIKSVCGMGYTLELKMEGMQLQTTIIRDKDHTYTRMDQRLPMDAHIETSLDDCIEWMITRAIDKENAKG